MKVKLIGKQHIEGVSKKTGKPYNSNIAYIVRTETGVEGFIGDKIWLDPATYPLDNLILNSEYELEYNYRGWLVSFAPVK